MTNEEAREQLNLMKAFIGYDSENPLVKKMQSALDIAIKDLEHRDCENCIHSDKGKCAYTETCHECMWESKFEQPPCEDCISRQKALDCFEQTNTRQGAKYAIETLPSVTPTNEDISEAYIKGYDYGVKDWFKSKTQPCEDAVSRTLVHEAITASIAESENPYEIWQRIEALPSVTPQQTRWIPVSERLPETRDEVLISLADGRITIASYNDHFLPFFNKPIGWGVDPKTFVFSFSSDDVIAWMPLPEPYKAESEEK